MSRLLRSASLAASAALLAACQSAARDTSAEPLLDTLPVITRVADENIPYPTAGVSGSIKIRNDCLVLDDAVVFWPAGTTWDGANSAVEFGGDFAGSERVVVGAPFTGGGGVYGVNGVEGVLDESAQQAVRECVEATDAASVVMVYPEWPAAD